MKKIFLLILTFSYYIAAAQSGLILSASDMSEGSTFFDRVKSANSGKSLKYDEILGTPYLSNNFTLGKVAENYERIPIRYNSYTDEVEFQKDEKIYILPKDLKFSKIEFTSPKQTLILENINDLNGYYFEIVSGKNKLYKKIKTKFIDIISGGTSYSSDTSASFKTLDPIYYIKTEQGYIKNPRNEKEITQYFPEKKEDLMRYIKSNNIKIKKEEDLIKIVTFLNK